MVLLLTGSIEGAKRQVYDFIGEFTAYDWLWKDSMQAAYEAFKARAPTIEDFENEIRKYVDVEQQISKISPVQNIGAPSLETNPHPNPNPNPNPDPDPDPDPDPGPNQARSR